MKKIFLLSLMALAIACVHKPNDPTSNAQQDPYLRWYSQVRHQLEPSWRETVSIKLKDITGKGYVIRDRGPYVVKLDIQVSPEGNIKDIVVLEKSQVEAIDQAGIEVFQKIAPLPRPPAEIVKEGVARMRWDFVVE